VVFAIRTVVLGLAGDVVVLMACLLVYKQPSGCLTI